MSKEVKISNIQIKMGSHDLDLTVLEARELKKLLDGLFGSQNNFWWPYYPYIILKRSPCQINDWEITSNNSRAIGTVTFSYTANLL